MYFKTTQRIVGCNSRKQRVSLENLPGRTGTGSFGALDLKATVQMRPRERRGGGAGRSRAPVAAPWSEYKKLVGVVRAGSTGHDFPKRKH